MAHDNANNPVGQIIGRNIRALRDANGQSQVQFAEMIGISRPYLNQIEKGKMNWSLKMLVKIADGLDVPIVGDALYGRLADRLMLHAASLEFRHPVTGEEIRITAKVPF